MLWCLAVLWTALLEELFSRKRVLNRGPHMFPLNGITDDNKLSSSKIAIIWKIIYTGRLASNSDPNIEPIFFSRMARSYFDPWEWMKRQFWGFKFRNCVLGSVVFQFQSSTSLDRISNEIVIHIQFFNTRSTDQLPLDQVIASFQAMKTIYTI